MISQQLSAYRTKSKPSLGEVMDIQDPHHQNSERRVENRTVAGKFHSVQFTAHGLETFYQFKLWNISQKGMCILVKENSAVLKHLKTDDIIEMTFYAADNKGENPNLNTQIKHITKNQDGRFEGHYLIGLEIL